MLMERKGWDKTQWVLHLHEFISDADYEQLLQDEKQLINHVPPQYLIGSTEFFGRRFKVTKEVLIPRVETEELVQLALLMMNQTSLLKVIDIGVGCGVIAISLSLECPLWQVYGVHISLRALEVARENANMLAANVHFFEGDVLTPFLEKSSKFFFDLMISNPPYIAYSEVGKMDQSVLKYEPKLALFAEDEGLAVYKKIAKQAPLLLKKKGILLLEIGYTQGETVSKLMREGFHGKREIEIFNDLSGKPRIVMVKPEK